MGSELGGRLLDHPEVQLELFEDLESRKELYEEYKREIDFHFFYSYYLETLRFYICNNGRLSVDYFRNMQRLLTEKIGNIKDNPCFQLMSDRPHLLAVSDTVDMHFDREEELKLHLKTVF